MDNANNSLNNNNNNNANPNPNVVNKMPQIKYAPELRTEAIQFEDPQKQKLSRYNPYEQRMNEK